MYAIQQPQQLAISDALPLEAARPVSYSQLWSWAAEALTH